VRLHADHPDDYSIEFRDPEMAAGVLHVRRINVVDVEPGVILCELSTDEPFVIEARTIREVSLAEAANLVRT
jgi:hypothetical protein